MAPALFPYGTEAVRDSQALLDVTMSGSITLNDNCRNTWDDASARRKDVSQGSPLALPTLTMWPLARDSQVGGIVSCGGKAARVLL